MGVSTNAKKVLLVGVDEPLMPELVQALDGRGTPATRVTLSELAVTDAEEAAVVVLSTAAARVAQPRMLQAFVDAQRSIVALSRETAAVDKLRSTTGTSVIHVSPADGANEVSSQIVALLRPAEDISNTETVRPPPGMLPEEVEKEMTGPHTEADLAAAEPPPGAGSDELPELGSDLLESVRPSAGPGAGASPPGAPPPPPPPHAPDPGPGDAPAAAPPSPAAPPFPPRVTPTPDVAAPRKGGSAGKVAALAILGLGVLAVLGVGGWALLGGGGEAPTAQATSPGPAPDTAAPPPSAAEPTAADEPPGAGEGEPSAEPAATDQERTPEEPPAEATPEPGPSAPTSATPEERIAAARAADVERDPRESDRLVVEAEHQMAQDDLAGAARSLDRALALDPDNPRAHAWLGRLHTARGEGALAVQWLELAIHERSRRTEYRLWLGDALKAAGDVDGARRAWFRVRRDEGDSRELRERLQSLR